MLTGWWGKLVLLVLSGLFLGSVYTSYAGTFVPPLGAAKKHIRQGSKHYNRGRTYRGFFYGGGFRGGK